MKMFQHGGDIYKYTKGNKSMIDFSANINTLGPTLKMKETYEHAFSKMNHYPDLECSELVETLVALHNVDPEHLYIGNGGIELIHFAITAVKAKRAAVVFPTFVEYEKVILNSGKEIVPYFTNDDDFQINIEKLIGFLEVEKPDLLIICNPNNPTGFLLEKEEIDQILWACKAQGIYLFYDEAFMDFTDEYSSLIHNICDYDRLFIFRSLTKFFSIPALRIGYLLTASLDFKTEFEQKHIPWSVNQVAQDVANEGLKDKAFIELTKEYYFNESIRMSSHLKKIPGLKVWEPYANFIFFRVESPIDLREALIEKGLLIRSCDNYRGLDASYYRVAIKKQYENDYLIEMIEQILKNSA